VCVCVSVVYIKYKIIDIETVRRASEPA